MLGGKWLQEATIHMPKNWSKAQPKASHYSSTLNIYVVLYGCQPSVHYSGTCIRIGNISLEVMEGNPPVPAISRPLGLESFSELSQRKSSRRGDALDFCQAELTRCRERAQCAADTAERVISDKRPKIDCFHFLVVFLVMIAAKSARPGGSSLRSLKSWSVWSAKEKTMRRTG